LARFSVRLRDRFSVPTTVPDRAARSRCQGWPEATAGGGAKRPWRRRARREAVVVGRGIGVDKTAGRIRGELACRGGTFKRSAATLYSGDPFWVGDHDAVMRIVGEAPKGGPILQERHEGHGWARDTATSDRHRQCLARRRTRTE